MRDVQRRPVEFGGMTLYQVAILIVLAVLVFDVIVMAALVFWPKRKPRKPRELPLVWWDDSARAFRRR
jgi:uncharacterized iron-regulated membrane protein